MEALERLAGWPEEQRQLNALLNIEVPQDGREEPEKVEAYKEEKPTDSHALAHADHEEKGAAQLDHGHTEVRDLGWHEDAKEVPTPLVGGLPNEELWALIRRFNKVGRLKSSAGMLKLKVNTANVPCESSSRTTSWRT